MNRRIASITVLLWLVLSAACAPQADGATTAAQPVTITVMAAASLTGAFGEIGRMYESQNPGVRVAFNFAGSNQLAQQIIQGAQSDVFASANQAQVDAVIKAGQVDEGAARVFAQNRLVVVIPQDNPGQITRLQDLARPGMKIILAAKEVPAGQYSLDFLDTASQAADFGAGYREDVLQNVASYETNVKAILTKVSLGEADAGIVYTTDAAGVPENTITQIDIPDAYNVIASYPIAALTGSKHPALAQSFVELVLSEEGQAVLSRYGFLPVSQP